MSELDHGKMAGIRILILFMYFTPQDPFPHELRNPVVANAWDRIRMGSVVDFLEVHIVHYHWPDFNVADSAIVVGASLLLLDSLLPKKTHL